jgi:hypothetical protein
MNDDLFRLENVENAFKANASPLAALHGADSRL